MSVDECNALIQAELEKNRLEWFYNYRANGIDIQRPEQICRFEWEKPKSKGQEVSKEELVKKRKRAEKALEKWQNNRLT